MSNSRWLLPLSLVALVACKSGAAPGTKKGTATVAPQVTATAAATTVAAAPPAPAGNAPSPAAPTPTGAAPSAHEVEWKGNVAWHSWDEALPIAKRESKPILVLVYADWCPHCRELAPAFADPQVEALAKRFVMVRQNHDDDPAWLKPYNEKYGGYVPRIFFFDSKAQLRDDIVSGHPRYPFFYAAEHIDLLKQSMRRVIGS